HFRAPRIVQRFHAEPITIPIVKSARDFLGTLAVFFTPTNIFNAIFLPLIGGGLISRWPTTHSALPYLYRESGKLYWKATTSKPYSGRNCRTQRSWNAPASFS